MLLSQKKRKRLDKLLVTFTTQGLFDFGFAEFGEDNCVICMEDY